MPAPVIGGIIAGAGAVGSAAIQSHAAGKAADQQVAAGDKALALQRDIYNQQQANEAPWRNVGAASITTLGGLLGLPSAPAGGGGQLPSSTLGSSLPYGPLPNDTQTGALTDPNAQPDASYNAQGQWIGNQPQAVRATLNSTSSYPTPQSFGSGVSGPPMLKVKAPNGNVYTVPAEKAAEVQQNGGVVLGTA